MDEGMQLSQFFTIDTLKADDGSVLTDRSGKQMAKQSADGSSLSSSAETTEEIRKYIGTLFEEERAQSVTAST